MNAPRTRVVDCEKWFQYRERKSRYDMNRPPSRPKRPNTGVLVDNPPCCVPQDGGEFIGERPGPDVVGVPGMIDPSFSFLMSFCSMRQSYSQASQR
jgi:hypothetical protein